MVLLLGVDCAHRTRKWYCEKEQLEAKNEKKKIDAIYKKSMETLEDKVKIISHKINKED